METIVPEVVRLVVPTPPFAVTKPVKVEAPVTPRVEPKVVAPSALNVESASTCPEAVIVVVSIPPFAFN